MSPEPHWAGQNPVTDTGGGGTSTLADLSDVSGQPGPGKSPVYDDTGIANLIEITTEQRFEDVLTVVATVELHNIGDPGEPPFLNSFAAYGPAYCTPRWRLAANNVVHLEGLICRTVPLDHVADAGTPMFQLPAELAPDAAQMFIAGGSGPSISYLDLRVDGTLAWGGILFGADAETAISLCGISWNATSNNPIARALK